MKQLKILTLALGVAWGLSVAAYGASDLFAIKTASPPPEPQQTCSLSVEAGQVLEFTASDLERRLSLSQGALEGITVTSLPSGEEGELVLYGVAVEPYQFIARKELEGLCFVPGRSAAAGLTLIPKGGDGQPSRLTINLLNAPNRPPVAEGGIYATVKGSRLTGYAAAYDPDGDAILIKVTRQPQKGDVSFQGQGFVYEPYQSSTGSDSFAFVAVDRFGNYSEEAVAQIKIERNRTGFRFQDMAGNPSQYAAYKLHEKGVFSGEKAGASWFFHPDRQMTRGEFLVLTLAAAGLDEELPPTVNTGLEGDAELPYWIKGYLRRALDKEIWLPNQAFSYSEIPTRAEAVQLVDRAAKITDVKDAPLAPVDLADIPTWALSSYKNLAAYRMLDLHDGRAHPGDALDNAYAADLLWQLYKHTHR